MYFPIINKLLLPKKTHTHITKFVSGSQPLMGKHLASIIKVNYAVQGKQLIEKKINKNDVA